MRRPRDGVCVSLLVCRFAPGSARSRQAAAGRGLAGPGAPGRGAAGVGGATRGNGCGGRCCAPTALRGSLRGRAAKLATLAARAPLGQSPRVRGTKRAARADPEAALLGAADIAACGAAHARRAPPGRTRPGQAPARGRLPRKQRWGSPDRRRQSSSRAPQRFEQRRGLPVAGVPVRSREAQHCRPAREARFVPLTRRDCLSAAREARVASFAAGPAVRASQGTPAKRGQAPARRRRAGRAFARPDACPRRPLAPPHRESSNVPWSP